LLEKIKAEHTASRGNYGSPTLYRKLRHDGETVNHKRVERLMKEHGMTAKRVRKFTRTTTSGHSLPIAHNVLGRNFSVAHPDVVWTSDITYVWRAQGWLYLAVCIDLYSRLVVGWAVSEQLHIRMIEEAFNEETMGQSRRGRGVSPLVHRDSRQPICECGVQKTVGDVGRPAKYEPPR
jgi:transposase InsO family protein